MIVESTYGRGQSKPAPMNTILAQQLVTDAIDITHNLPLTRGDMVVTHASQKICKIIAINGNVATIQESTVDLPFDVHITSLGSLAIWQLLASVKTGSTVLVGVTTPAPGPACCGCRVATHDETIPLFEGQVLPPTWAGTWTRAAACATCAARQQALRHPVTLMVFRHMRKGT